MGVKSCFWRFAVHFLSYPGAERYRFYSKLIDNKEVLLFDNKLTGTKEQLIRNPFKSMTEIRSKLYGNGDLVYYLKYDLDKSQLKPFENHVSVIGIDSRTFEEKIVFEQNLGKMENNLYGGADYLDYIGDFFLDEDNIYFINDKKIVSGIFSQGLQTQFRFPEWEMLLIMADIFIF